MQSCREHIPVLLNEAIAALAIKANGCYLDATYGRGGHSSEILKRLDSDGRIYAVDKDLGAVSQAREMLVDDSRFKIYHSDFSNFEHLAESDGLLGKFDGALLDLGVSSPQLDNPERGFSFNKDGPLDMRMNASSGITAAQWVKQTDQDEMVRVFREYGEERYSSRIARAITKYRQSKDITSTLQLAELVKQAHPRWERGKHPATRVFQAIRIEVNAELDSLKRFLLSAEKLLNERGRLVVISFHSLEDRIVKRFMRDGLRPQAPLRNLPVMSESAPAFRVVAKPVYPGSTELDLNVRARSSVLRVAERCLK